jgi:hypothetical protein
MKIEQMFAATAALALIAGGPAFAAKSQDRETTAGSDGGGAGVKAKDERKTCRTFRNTVSRIKREKLCLTREGWKEFERTQSE